MKNNDILHLFEIALIGITCPLVLPVFAEKEEKMKNKTPIPEYHANEPILYCGCGADNKSHYKDDCYFYHSEPNMGGHISCCDLYKGLGNCPCKSCDKYLSKSDAFKIVVEHIKSDKESKNDEIQTPKKI